MPVKLNTPAEDFDTDDTRFDTMLGNLQANILKPHGRDFARHIFLRFTAPPAAVKAWIRTTVAPGVTTALQQFRTPPHTDGGVVAGFFLSAAGYQHLGLKLNGFESGVFRKGMKDQHDGLLEPLLDTDNKDPEPNRWEPPYRDQVHALATFADDVEANAEAAAEALRQSAAGIATVLTTERGNTLRRTNPLTGTRDPVEHFGYFDGISQPVFTRKDYLKAKSRGHWEPGARLSLVLVDDPLTDQADAFGSYLVYRKLGQDTTAFTTRVNALATSLGVTPELAGAMVVGRFKDGTPVLRAASPGLGDENDFNFREDVPGERCPHHAHIRKVNPRGTTPATSLDSERKRRIARRGIPYGPPLPGVADKPPPDPNTALPRGLLFMCFQSDIGDHFEFLQRTWVDNEHFPTGVFTLGALGTNTGDDPLIGQNPDAGQKWPKKWGDHAAGKKSVNFESAVTLEGGEYFFAPSLPFLTSL
jgi:Dyp-type peroxidase family